MFNEQNLLTEALENVDNVPLELRDKFLNTFLPVPSDTSIEIMPGRPEPGKAEVFGTFYSVIIEASNEVFFFDFIRFLITSFDVEPESLNAIVALPSLIPGSPVFTGISNKKGSLVFYGPDITTKAFDSKVVTLPKKGLNNKETSKVKIEIGPSRKALRDSKKFMVEIRGQDECFKLVSQLQSSEYNSITNLFNTSILSDQTKTNGKRDTCLSCTQIAFSGLFKTDLVDISLVENALQNQCKLQNLTNSTLVSNKDKDFVRVLYKQPKGSSPCLIIGGSSTKETALLSASINTTVNENKVLCEAWYFLNRTNAHQIFMQFISQQDFKKKAVISGFLASQLYVLLKRLAQTEFFNSLIGALEKKRVNIFMRKRSTQAGELNTKEKWLQRSFSGIINHFKEGSDNNDLYTKDDTSIQKVEPRPLSEQLLVLKGISELLPYLQVGINFSFLKEEESGAIIASFFRVLNRAFSDINLISFESFALTYPSLRPVFEYLKNQSQPTVEEMIKTTGSPPQLEVILAEIETVMAAPGFIQENLLSFLKWVSFLQYYLNVPKADWSISLIEQKPEIQKNVTIFILKLMGHLNTSSITAGERWLNIKQEPSLQNILIDIRNFIAEKPPIRTMGLDTSDAPIGGLAGQMLNAPDLE